MQVILRFGNVSKGSSSGEVINEWISHVHVHDSIHNSAFRRISPTLWIRSTANTCQARTESTVAAARVLAHPIAVAWSENAGASGTSSWKIIMRECVGVNLGNFVKHVLTIFAYLRKNEPQKRPEQPRPRIQRFWSSWFGRILNHKIDAVKWYKITRREIQG